jgi:hypothetical protein
MLWRNSEASLPQRGLLFPISTQAQLARALHCWSRAMISQDPEPTTNIASQVIDSAVALLRAEVILLWSHMRSAGSRSLTAASLTVIALNLTPVALLILALSPVLGALVPGELVLASAAPVTLLAVLAWILSIKRWRNVFQSKPQHNGISDPVRLNLRHEDISRR